MSTIILHVVHWIYRLILTLYSIWRSFTCHFNTPAPLLAPRRQTPKHVALILLTDDVPQQKDKEVMIDSLWRTVEWCRTARIEHLSVFDRDGILKKSLNDLHRPQSKLLNHAVIASDDLDSKTFNLDLQYPLTPPASDHSEANSRSWSPEPFCDLSTPVVSVTLRDRGKNTFREQAKRTSHSTQLSELKLHVLSRDAGKPCLASLARAIAATQPRSRSQKHSNLPVTVEDLDTLIQGTTGWPDVDLLIIYPIHPRRSCLEFDGFPPWQIRLSEIYFTSSRAFSLRELVRRHVLRSDLPTAIDEVTFRRALDSYASAEMRLGK